MEQELFFSGYCRQLDSPRQVCCVVEDGTITEVDCLYPGCPFQKDCPIGKNLENIRR